MTPLDEIRAGKYELAAVSWDQTTSKPHEPYDYTRHVQGDIVTLDVEQARRLYLAGAVVRPGEREELARDAALAAAMAAQAAYDAALAKASPDPAPSVAPGQPVEPVVDGVPPQSGLGSGKQVWLDYAGKHKVQVPEEATREQIIEAVAAAGVPTGQPAPAQQ